VDGTVKTIMIDDSATVAENLAMICEKVGLPNPEEFSLQVHFPALSTESNILFVCQLFTKKVSCLWCLRFSF
jgi:hypothetical protein